MEKTKKFIEKARVIWKDTIDFSKVHYVNSVDKVCLICHKKGKDGNEHGEYWQSPSSCLRGYGCPKCANERRGPRQDKRMSTEKFIDKAKAVHGNKYDYSETKYSDPDTRVTIICPTHGVFPQLPYAHLNGQGCPKCKGRNIDFDELIRQFNEIHNGKYSYENFVYINKTTKGLITCPIHGDFTQTASKHLIGQGCPKCKGAKANINRHLTLEEFIERANRIHDNEYDYSEVSFASEQDKVNIICTKHGKFPQRVYDHLNGHGCPKCGFNTSNAEDEIKYQIESILGEGNVLQRNRELISPYELDLYIPRLKLAIEYDGLVWHSEKFKSNNNYHINKLSRCLSAGLRLITVFEDEYVQHKDIVLDKIAHIIGKTAKDKVYGRKCQVREIDKSAAKKFLDENHIQGFVPSTVYLGAYHGSELAGVMTFRRENTEGHWELARCATDMRYNCVGVCSKMFSHFTRRYNPARVKSFADRRWTVNYERNVYTAMGFELEEMLPPDYSYVTKKGERSHKFNFRKALILRNYPDAGLTADMTESEMTARLGLYRIWNCGLLKYVWTQKKP